MSRPHDPSDHDAEPRARPTDFPDEPETERQDTEERPEPRRHLDRHPRPRLRRLGRGALAALAIGVMVLLTTLTLQYSRESLEQAAASAPAPIAPRPVDLRRLEELRARLPAPPPADPLGAEAAESLAPPLPAPPPPAPSRDASDHRAAWRSSLTTRAATTRAATTPGPSEPQASTPAELTAAFDAFAGRPAASSPTQPPAWLRPPADQTPLTTAPSPPAPDPPPRNLLPPAPDTATHHAVLTVPASPYLLRAGELLPAILTQRVVSDQPGTLRAVVSRDVRDSLAGTSVLVPRGTVLVGRQGSLPGFGQDRLAVVWTRLLFPDGRSLELDSAGATPAASAARDGTAGLDGRVNHHWGRRYAAAALLSLVSAGVQLSQPQSGSLLEPDTPGSRAAGALGRELGRTSDDILRRYADLPPTIELSPGARVHAVLLQDLAFASPYQPLHR